jgi:hypothetical protein
MQALESLLLNKGALTSIERATGLLIATFERKGRVHSCGGGGNVQCSLPKSLLRQRWEIAGKSMVLSQIPRYMERPPTTHCWAQLGRLYEAD